MHVVAVYGGTSIGMQIKDIKRGVQIDCGNSGKVD